MWFAALLLTALSFTTGAVRAAGPAPVNLGTSGNYVILSKSGITDVPDRKSVV